MHRRSTSCWTQQPLMRTQTVTLNAQRQSERPCAMLGRGMSALRLALTSCSP